MLKRFNPPEIAKPASNYSHGVVIPPGARVLHVSGQIGVRPDGSVGETFKDQVEIAYDNLLAILAHEGMGPADVVKLTVLLTPHGDLATSRAVRDQKMQGHAPASTLMIVAGLAAPKYLFEVEAIAAKA